jgi:hypothetical protein
MAEPTYQRIASARFGLSGLGSLWLGPDHLLQVRTSFGVERYRRWFFKDVQAFVARRTATRLLWNLIVGGCGLAIGAGAVACMVGTSSSTGIDSEALMIIAGILGFISLACFGIVIANTLLGPSCIIHVQTPLGIEKLTVPTRLNAFLKISARVAPLIEDAQSAQRLESLSPPVA